MSRYIVHIRESAGRYYVDFHFENMRIKEYLKLPVSEKNERRVLSIKTRLEDAMQSKNVTPQLYGELFPKTKKIPKLFGVVHEKDMPSFSKYFEENFLPYQIQRLGVNEISDNHFKSFRKCFNNVPDGIKTASLNTIRKGDIDKYRLSRLEAGRKAKTVREDMDFIKSVLKHACDNGYLKEDEIPNISRPASKGEESDIRPFSESELVKLLGFTMENKKRYYLLFLTAVLTGMRPEEVLGMEWCRVDLEKRIYRVETVITGNKKKDGPKNKSSLRNVKLAQHIVDELERIPNEQRNGFVFKTQRSNYYTSCQSINKDVLKVICEKVGIPYRPFHQFRHTYAIQSIRQYEKPDVIARQMGHSSLDMLFRKYARFIHEDDNVPLKIEGLASGIMDKMSVNCPSDFEK